MSYAYAPAPVAVALDAPNLETACTWASDVAPYVSHVKIGLETYLRDGAVGVAAIRQQCEPHAVKLFLDLKLHDIPNTVAGAARSVAPLAPDFLTVHALGGPDMIAAAAAALPDTRITAVTILTSMDEAALAAVGISGDSAQAVVRLASMAVAAGARALVCSPLEVALVRATVGPEVVLVTPGVRPAHAALGDQKRIATPQQAREAGADLLVIGRPITGAADPAKAAETIRQGLL